MWWYPRDAWRLALFVNLMRLRVKKVVGVVASDSSRIKNYVTRGEDMRWNPNDDGIDFNPQGRYPGYCATELKPRTKKVDF